MGNFYLDDGNFGEDVPPTGQIVVSFGGKSQTQEPNPQKPPEQVQCLPAKLITAFSRVVTHPTEDIPYYGDCNGLPVLGENPQCQPKSNDPLARVYCFIIPNPVEDAK